MTLPKISVLFISLVCAASQAQTLPDAKLSEPTQFVPIAKEERSESALRPEFQSNTPSIEAPSTAQFAKLCENTADPADCGKKVEVAQLKREGANAIAKRDGKLLAITIPGEPPFIFEDIDSEAGPNVSFYAYSNGADSVVLFRARSDKVDFLMLHRPTGIVSELPNEPKFNRDGRYFATADFCKEGCENRIAIWRIERRGAIRERVFAPRTPWDDADVSWGANIRLVVDTSEKGRRASFNLEVNDARWTVLAP